MLELKELRKFQEYQLKVKKCNSSFNKRLETANNLLLNGNFFGIISFHSDINILKIKIYVERFYLLKLKIYDKNNPDFSDFVATCILESIDNIDNILTNCNFTMSMKGIIQFKLNNNKLYISLYEPQNDISAKKLNKIIHAIS